MLEVAGVRLRVRDTGPKGAPALIMLHGFGSSLETWEPWARALQTDYRVIRFDLPGTGLSAPDPTSDYTDARSVDVLAGLMDRLGLDRASLIGNSIGGAITWTFAAQRPHPTAPRIVAIDHPGNRRVSISPDQRLTTST
jgi:pimeloyl-ACP methyl ester carboxylesterase